MLMLQRRRPAFTLIELLIVIGLIVLISAIGVMAVPSVQDRNMQTGADQLQGWLLIAKQRAKRDGLPCGLRIDFTNGEATQCVYIQQPDDYAIPGSSCTVSATTVTFANGANVNGATAVVDLNVAGVQAGDYLEFYRGGGVYQIASVTSTAATQSVTLVTSPPTFLGTNNSTGSVAEYRIRRQPIPIAGEDVLQLPSGIVIDNNKWTDTSGGPAQTKCQNIAAWPFNANSNYVLFSPQGGIVGRNSGSDHLCVLWLSNTTNTTTPPLLLSIQAHTGLIGVQPVANGTPPYTSFNATTGNPYQLCRDGRASGL